MEATIFAQKTKNIVFLIGNKTLTVGLTLAKNWNQMTNSEFQKASEEKNKGRNGNN